MPVRPRAGSSLPVLSLLLAALTLLAGCRTVAEAPPDLSAPEAYQTIANQLPRADLGWGEPPAVASMAASERRAPRTAAEKREARAALERHEEPPPPPTFDLSCDERRFGLVVEVFRPRLYAIPYAAIEQVSYRYCAFPNALFCVVFPFLQVSEARVVFDARKVDGLFDQIESECQRLEQIGREIGMGGPYEYAGAVRAKVRDDARELGEGRLSVRFSYASPVPPWFPYTAPARRTAEAFAFVKAHPDLPAPPEPKPASPPSRR